MINLNGKTESSYNYTPFNMGRDPFYFIGDILDPKPETGINKIIDSLFCTSVYINTGEKYIETKDSYIIYLELPGIDKTDINIDFDKDVVTLTAEKKDTVNNDIVKTFISSVNYAKITRSYKIPGEIKLDDVNAEFVNGVLHLTLPKAEATKPKQITIK